MTPADLKAWRAQEGLSQQALASLLGIKRNTIARWEMGLHPIPPYLPLALETLKSEKVS